MIRKIIKIDTEKCDGCGLCAKACHEGAIGIVHGKAKLLREDYCDGLGNCLPVCPRNAISFEEREAAEFDQEAVNRTQKTTPWPIQIQLTSVNHPRFNNADLLIAADCTGYVKSDFLQEYCSGKELLIGCPKLDNCDYSEKLSEIFAQNNVKSITLTRMQVPCCGGMNLAIKSAIDKSGKDIPYNVITLSINGEVL